MELRCLIDYNYSRRPSLGEPTMREMIALLANPRRGKETPEELPSEFLYEFKAGQTYDLPDDLAARLLRDHGPIDYFAWKLAQSRSDMPIVNPPRRPNPTFEAANPWDLQRLEAEREQAEEARRATVPEVQVMAGV